MHPCIHISSYVQIQTPGLTANLTKQVCVFFLSCIKNPNCSGMCTQKQLGQSHTHTYTKIYIRTFLVVLLLSMLCMCITCLQSWFSVFVFVFFLYRYCCYYCFRFLFNDVLVSVSHGFLCDWNTSRAEEEYRRACLSCMYMWCLKRNKKAMARFVCVETKKCRKLRNEIGFLAWKGPTEGSFLTPNRADDLHLQRHLGAMSTPFDLFGHVTPPPLPIPDSWMQITSICISLVFRRVTQTRRALTITWPWCRDETWGRCRHGASVVIWFFLSNGKKIN